MLFENEHAWKNLRSTLRHMQDKTSKQDRPKSRMVIEHYKAHRSQARRSRLDAHDCRSQARCPFQTQYCMPIPEPKYINKFIIAIFVHHLPQLQQRAFETATTQGNIHMQSRSKPRTLLFKDRSASLCAYTSLSQVAPEI